MRSQSLRQNGVEMMMMVWIGGQMNFQLRAVQSTALDHGALGLVDIGL